MQLLLAPEMFSAVEMQKKISLYNRTVPLLTLMAPVFTRGGGEIKISSLSARYLWWLYNNKIFSSLIHSLLKLTDQAETGWETCAMYHVPTLFRLTCYHNTCIQWGSYCLNYKVNSKTLALYWLLQPSWNIFNCWQKVQFHYSELQSKTMVM